MLTSSANYHLEIKVSGLALESYLSFSPSRKGIKTRGSYKCLGGRNEKIKMQSMEACEITCEKEVEFFRQLLFFCIEF